MKVEVIMPQMGESIVEELSTWFKQPEQRKAGRRYLQISTDKVDADIPSPEGVLQEILVNVGAIVEGGGRLYSDAEPRRRTDAGSKDTPAEPTKQAEKATSTAVGKHLKQIRRGLRQPTRKAPEASSVEELRRTRSTPLVISKEHNVISHTADWNRGLRTVTKRIFWPSLTK